MRIKSFKIFENIAESYQEITRESFYNILMSWTESNKHSTELDHEILFLKRNFDNIKSPSINDGTKFKLEIRKSNASMPTNWEFIHMSMIQPGYFLPYLPTYNLFGIHKNNEEYYLVEYRKTVSQGKGETPKFFNCDQFSEVNDCIKMCLGIN